MTEKTVFISSTSRDLAEYNRAVYQSIEGLDGYHAVQMEYFGARDALPIEHSIEQAAQCDLFVGIIGQLYGHIPEGEEYSITEREYQTAVAADCPRLMFVMANDVPLSASLRESDEKYAKLQAFRSKVLEGQIVDFFREPQELARRVLQAIRNWEQGFETAKPRALLSLKKFIERSHHIALVGHKGPFVGRKRALSQIKDHLEDETSIIILHGPGGVGKTRLLLTLPNLVPDGAQLWYARTEAETVEDELAELDPEKHHVIVVDDAHQFEPLPHLRELLVNPDFASKVKLVLATRNAFCEQVGFRFSQVAGDRIAEIAIDSLADADIDQLLQSQPYEIVEDDVRHALVVIAGGNPLIAQVGANLAQRGTSVIGLSQDVVLTRYLDELIHDLAEAGYDEQYIIYLEVLAALGTLDLSNENLRKRVQQVVDISQIEEDRIVSRLVRVGLVERYWMKLKIASEVLADHILISHFFDPQTKRADYQLQIIEPFLPLKPKQILTNLAKAEAKGESREAGLLLGSKLNELYRLVDEGGNIARLNMLEWLEEVAYLRPDEALAIVVRIMNGPELPPESCDDPLWPSYAIDHELVLRKAVDITSRTVYRGNLRDAVTYLHRLARYRPTVVEYDRVREKAEKALVDIAEFKPRKPYAIQLTLLSLVSEWLGQDFAGNLDLALALIQPILKIHLESVAVDPVDTTKVTWKQGLLSPSEPLRRIREQALRILSEAYRRSATVSERLKIIRAFDGAVPRFIPSARIPDETIAWLERDCLITSRLFSSIVPATELPVLDTMANWLWRAKRRYGGVDELEELSTQLDSHELYQLYRVLVGWNRLDEKGELDFRETAERRQGIVYSYIRQLSAETLEQSIRDLDVIAAQARAVEGNSTRWLDHLLRTLGEENADLACKFVERSLAEDLDLKHHLGFLIAGLRRSAPDICWSYIESWVAGDDQVLWLAVAYSYSFVDWEELQDAEWNVLQQLVSQDSSRIDHIIIRLIRNFAPHNPDLAIELMRTMAGRGDERILQHIAEVLSWPSSIGDGWIIEFTDPQDYLHIIRNFERLPFLDFHVEECLSRMGQIAPMEVVDFLERRIDSIQERREEDESYTAVPIQFSRAMDTIRSSPQYLEALRRVRGWMLRDEPLFHWETPRVLSGIAGGLGNPLRQVLMEWINSGETEKLRAVAGILREFNEGNLFYDLCRRIIRITDDEATLVRIAGAIESTPGAIWGDLSDFSKRRLQEITPWLEDEDVRVRRFARQMVDSLQVMIEREQAQEELKRRSR